MTTTGFRFRKSVKFGPFRVNFSKSGVGYSFGMKGARITRTANGRNRATLSIPGTGISYVTESSAKQNKNGVNKQMKHQSAGSSMQPPKKPSGGKKPLQWFVSAFLLFCTVMSFPSAATILFLAAFILMLPVSKLQGSIRKFLKPALKTIAVIALVFFGFALIPKSETPTPQKTLSVKETEAPTAPATVPETEAPTTLQTEPPTKETTKETIPTISGRDYVLNTSTMKIHHPTCSSVKDIKDSNRKDYHGTYDELTAKGYTACGRCKPF